MAVDWEEEVFGRIRLGLGGGKPCRKLYELDCFASNERDVAAGDAEVVQFAVRQAAQLVDGVTVAAPVAVVADQVHFLHPEVRVFVLAMMGR